MMSREIITWRNTYAFVLGVCILISIIGFNITANEVKKFVVHPHEVETYFAITNEVFADAAIIYDIGADQVIAGKNAKIPKSIASITKLMTALVAYSYINETDTTVINSADFALTPNTPLRLDDRWSTKELLEYSLITSSNRGINAIGRTVEEKTGVPLVDLMNTFVRKNGLVQTHFVNTTGLDAHRSLAGSESSARDLAKIAAIIVVGQKELAEVTTQKNGVFYSLKNIRYFGENTNKLIGVVPQNIVLSKTGYTDIAGGALTMVIEDNGKQIAFVVLDSTRSGRFEDMKTLFSLYERIISEDDRKGVENNI